MNAEVSNENRFCPTPAEASDRILKFLIRLIKSYRVLFQCAQHPEYTFCRHILTATGWGHLRDLESATDVELSSLLGRNIRHNGYRILFLARVLMDAKSVFFKCREHSNGLRHPPDIGYPCGVSSDYQLSTMNESGTVPSCTRPAAIVDQDRYLLGKPSQGALQHPSPILYPSHIAASAGLIPTLSYPHTTPFILLPSTIHHASPQSVLPQAPSNLYMTMGPYPHLPQTSYSPNAVTLTSFGGEPYIQQPWPTQPLQMPLSSAYDQSTTSSAMTKIEPVERQVQALKIEKTKLPISVEDNKSGYGRRQKKEEYRKREAQKREEQWQTLANGLVNSIRFQPGNWWLNTTHDWYPFIVSPGRIDPTGNVDCTTHDGPEKIILGHATQLSTKTARVTEGELFLLICLCLVVKQSVDEEKIYRAISMCVPSLTTNMIKDHMGAVFWVCKLMGSLSQFGWDSNVIALLVTCKPQSLGFGIATC